LTLRSLSSIDAVSDESSSESDDVLIDWTVGGSSEDSDEWEGLRKSFDRFLKISVKIFNEINIYKKRTLFTVGSIVLSWGSVVILLVKLRSEVLCIIDSIGDSIDGGDGCSVGTNLETTGIAISCCSNGARKAERIIFIK